ncbi:MAG: flagellar basal body rod protein FlgC [Sneathiella sp.]
MTISASGMDAQGQRMRVISENLANKDSMGKSADEDPYRRKVISFRNVLDRETNVTKVQVGRISEDRTEFDLKFNPSHPAANADGYVKMPNVNSLVEMMDMKETQRSYQANLGVIEASKKMIMRTLSILQQ